MITNYHRYSTNIFYRYKTSQAKTRREGRSWPFCNEILQSQNSKVSIYCFAKVRLFSCVRNNNNALANCYTHAMVSGIFATLTSKLMIIYSSLETRHILIYRFISFFHRLADTLLQFSKPQEVVTSKVVVVNMIVYLSLLAGTVMTTASRSIHLKST